MITILNNAKEVQKTSKACEVKVLHELMRMYTLDFNVAPNNPIVAYINKDCQIKVDGQLFDISRFNIDIGTQNGVLVSAVHVGYRLNNYKLVTLNYAFVGTRKKIAQDILNSCVDKDGNKASSEFKIGTCDDKESISFSLNNDQEVTAKYAIMALKNVGAESDFDNFTINFAKQMGTHTKDKPLDFKFGKNLAKVSRSWDSSSGETYQIDIADKDADIYVGDYIKFDVDFNGNTQTKRIITYTRFLDDPSKNSVTVGNFVSDITTEIVSMGVDIDKSVKQGEAYNNVSINHNYGFVSRADVNGNDIVSLFNSTTGPGMWVNNKKVWGVTPNGRQFTQSISNLKDSSWFAEMGVTGTGEQQGLTLTSRTTPRYLQMTESSGSVFFLDKNSTNRILLGTDSTSLSDNNGVERFSAHRGGTNLYDENGNCCIYMGSTNSFISSPNGSYSISVGNNGIYVSNNGTMKKL